MIITQCCKEQMDGAECLVKNVFKSMSPFERLSFLAIRRPKSIFGRLLMFLGGIEDLVAFDVCIDESGAVRGTTGLYRYRKDADEAVWVAWFCVDPLARGQGIGQRLIEHTIAVANKAGFKRLRLYTTTDPNEEAAQRLYERNGFLEVDRQKGMLVTKIFREREIQ